jgi:glycosyltransferase involved in cell wall biosynthesis
MKILMVIHQFLPRHLGGSEVYTYHLAQALRARGHRIDLFFTEIRPERRQYQLLQGEFEGIPYFEAVHNRYFASFRHRYWDAEMEVLFRKVLDTTDPDLVHLQHLQLHSIGYIDIARRRGLPVLYTLHEYLLMCLNDGLLLRPDQALCGGPEPMDCARCAARVHPRLVAGPLLSAIGSAARHVVPVPLREMTAKLRARLSAPEDDHTPAAHRETGPHLEAVRLRRSEIQAELDKVNLFLAPSQFLRRRFIDEQLVSPDRILHSDYGLPRQSSRRTRQRRSPVLQIGYVGTIAAHKGVHLILDAFREIREPGIACRIYGDLDTFPAYKKRLLSQGTPPAVRFMGRLDNAHIGEVLATLDLLIVPSIWFENSPLTIHEAYLAGVPVLTSDQGGMAELVEHGKTGLHFKLGDADDLRRQLLRVLHEPGLLDSLTAELPGVKTIEEDAADMEDRYRLLLHRS